MPTARELAALFEGKGPAFPVGGGRPPQSAARAAPPSASSSAAAAAAPVATPATAVPRTTALGSAAAAAAAAAAGAPPAAPAAAAAAAAPAPLVHAARDRPRRAGVRRPTLRGARGGLRRATPALARELDAAAAEELERAEEERDAAAARAKEAEQLEAAKAATAKAAREAEEAEREAARAAEREASAKAAQTDAFTLSSQLMTKSMMGGAAEQAEAKAAEEEALRAKAEAEASKAKREAADRAKAEAEARRDAAFRSQQQREAETQASLLARKQQRLRAMAVRRHRSEAPAPVELASLARDVRVRMQDELVEAHMLCSKCRSAEVTPRDLTSYPDEHFCYACEQLQAVIRFSPPDTPHAPEQARIHEYLRRDPDAQEGKDLLGSLMQSHIGLGRFAGSDSPDLSAADAAAGGGGGGGAGEEDGGGDPLLKSIVIDKSVSEERLTLCLQRDLRTLGELVAHFLPAALAFVPDVVDGASTASGTGEEAAGAAAAGADSHPPADSGSASSGDVSALEAEVADLRRRLAAAEAQRAPTDGDASGAADASEDEGASELVARLRRERDEAQERAAQTELKAAAVKATVAAELDVANARAEDAQRRLGARVEEIDTVLRERYKIACCPLCKYVVPLDQLPRHVATRHPPEADEDGADDEAQS